MEVLTDKLGNVFTQLAGRRVLVTGASGFIGRWLVERLRALNADVHGIARSTSRLPEGIRGWAVDLRHADALRSALEAIRPEIVFHLASFVTTRPDRSLVRPMLEHTLVGTVHLLNALADVSCQRVVLASSAESPLDRHGPVRSPYAAAKASAMLFATVFQRVYGLSTVVLRPTLVFGAGQPQDKLIPYIISSLRRGAEPMLANPNRICDLLYVRDLVHALCLAAVKPGIEGSTIDVGSGNCMSVAHIALRIARLLDRSISLEIEPARAVCETDLVVDTEPAARHLAWRADWEFENAMRATIDSYAPIIERRNVA